LNERGGREGGQKRSGGQERSGGHARGREKESGRGRERERKATKAWLERKRRGTRECETVRERERENLVSCKRGNEVLSV